MKSGLYFVLVYKKSRSQMHMVQAEYWSFANTEIRIGIGIGVGKSTSSLRWLKVGDSIQKIMWPFQSRGHVINVKS